MRGVASETGSISPTIVEKIVRANIMVTPEKNPVIPQSIKKIIRWYITVHTSSRLNSLMIMRIMIISSYLFHSCSCIFSFPVMKLSVKNVEIL
jgi:hypothetical protein